TPPEPRHLPRECARPADRAISHLRASLPLLPGSAASRATFILPRHCTLGYHNSSALGPPRLAMLGLFHGPSANCHCRPTECGQIEPVQLACAPPPSDRRFHSRGDSRPADLPNVRARP